ncbi:MAG: transglutaminase-like domain-containing protein [Rikenellaceae bacterium]|nr:transglutaminase-like domain-containing protein [Rikenellaceae bacterium]
MRKVILITVALIIAGFTDGTHLISDGQIRDEVKKDFIDRMEMIGTQRAAHFITFTENPELTLQGKEALYFLLAYSPLCDLADCEPEYFLEQVRGAFRASDHFGWGRSVPEDIFRHFVLPFRINNENPDQARNVFFDELKERISGMTMQEAALEVNHGCHEKVEYRATDARTSAPLALVRTSWGRCGEESAFTAAALRAVAIPARQVYTPRWVHTDSNHAWVEVWIDGHWRYLGACEPEPQLDTAWFTAPATRAMMMHTTVPGKYRGPEETGTQTGLYTVINLLETYAPVRSVSVTVTDSLGITVPDAQVKFKVYNYSEFYPIATNKTAENGTVTLSTGFGDIYVWASKGDAFGYAKLKADSNETAITLHPFDGREYSEYMVMNVPMELSTATPAAELIAANRLRLAREDSKRSAYMATFPDKSYSSMLAAATGLDPEEVWKYLGQSQGNWKEIEAFIRAYKNNTILFPFLGSLSSKDLRDTPAANLSDHMPDSVPQSPGLWEVSAAEYIYSPRIDMEIITPWRSYLQKEVIDKYPGMRDDPLLIVRYVKENIRIDPAQNYVACLVTPKGVHQMRMADARSRNVYFVALCRTAGIPARIDSATGQPQFHRNGLWHDAVFEAEALSTTVQPTGNVRLNSPETNRIPPAYRSHYTLARYSNGDFATLDLAGVLSGRKYPVEIEIPAGYYRLTVGSRANDGSVSAFTEYFHLAPDRPKEISISLPELDNKLFVEGILDMNTVVFLSDGTKTTLKEISNGKGVILIFADPANEPTRHILQEMPGFLAQLENWGGGILFVQPADVASTTVNNSIFPDLHRQTIWIPDGENSLLNSAIESLRLDFSNEYPLVLYLNTSGGILFSNKGYRVGIVESLWETICTERGIISDNI